MLVGTLCEHYRFEQAADVELLERLGAETSGDPLRDLVSAGVTVPEDVLAVGLAVLDELARYGYHEIGVADASIVVLAERYRTRRNASLDRWHASLDRRHSDVLRSLDGAFQARRCRSHRRHPGRAFHRRAPPGRGPGNAVPRLRRRPVRVGDRRPGHRPQGEAVPEARRRRPAVPCAVGVAPAARRPGCHSGGRGLRAPRPPPGRDRRRDRIPQGHRRLPQRGGPHRPPPPGPPACCGRRAPARRRRARPPLDGYGGRGADCRRRRARRRHRKPRPGRPRSLPCPLRPTTPTPWRWISPACAPTSRASWPWPGVPPSGGRQADRSAGGSVDEARSRVDDRLRSCPCPGRSGCPL